MGVCCSKPVATSPSELQLLNPAPPAAPEPFIDFWSKVTSEGTFTVSVLDASSTPPALVCRTKPMQLSKNCAKTRGCIGLFKTNAVVEPSRINDATATVAFYANSRDNQLFAVIEVQEGAKQPVLASRRLSIISAKKRTWRKSSEPLNYTLFFTKQPSVELQFNFGQQDGSKTNQTPAKLFNLLNRGKVETLEDFLEDKKKV